MTRAPVSVITGFLGSGKTTLLNRLLPDPAMKGAAVSRRPVPREAFNRSRRSYLVM